MSSSPSLPNIELFDKFVNDPKNSNIQIVEGSRNYLQKVIAKDVAAPTNTTLVHLFGHFSKGKIKEYVYARMTKSILLELALAITQEIIDNGIARAKTIELEITGAKAKNKTVVISEKGAKDDFPMSADEASFIRDIDEASFYLHDSSGSSPGSKLTSGGSGSNGAAFRTPIKSRSQKNIFPQNEEVGEIP